MKKQFLKVVDPIVAEKMVAMGFHYILEKKGLTNVYAFSVTPQQIEKINSCFNKNDFIFDNRLSF